jgi:outer membrane lipoprotein-sorting protein
MMLKMMRTLLISLVLLTVLGATPGPCLALSPEEVVAEVQKKYADLTSLSADYTRITRTPAMEGVFQSSSEQTASGLLQFKQQAKLSLNQGKPETELMVTDGKTVWWYIPGENVVHLYDNVAVYEELKPLLDFLNGLSGLEGRFTIKAIPAGTANEYNHRLDLQRLTEGSGPTGITVWFRPQDYNLVGFRLTSLTGEATDFNLTNLVLNPELEDSVFTFRIPPGTEVLEETDKP